MRKKTKSKNVRSVEVEAVDTKQAIKIGLHKLGVPKEKTRIQILSEGHKGLFGMKGSSLAKVRIEVEKKHSK